MIRDAVRSLVQTIRRSKEEFQDSEERVGELSETAGVSEGSAEGLGEAAEGFDLEGATEGLGEAAEGFDIEEAAEGVGEAVEELLSMF